MGKFWISKFAVIAVASSFIAGGVYSLWRHQESGKVSGQEGPPAGGDFKLMAEIPVKPRQVKVKKPETAVALEAIKPQEPVRKVQPAAKPPLPVDPAPVVPAAEPMPSSTPASESSPSNIAEPPVVSIAEPLVVSTTEPPVVSPAEPITILISEIMFDAVGSDSGKEFIKLYNPTNADISIEDWSLKNGDNSLAKIGSKAEDIFLVRAKGYLTVGFYGYSPAEVIRSAQLPNGVAHIQLWTDGDEVLMDSADYDGGNFEEGQAWRRGI